MKRITSLILLALLLMMNITVSAANHITVGIVNFASYIDIEDNNIVIVKITNKTGIDADVVINMIVSDKDNTVVCEETTMVSVKNNSVVHHPVPLKIAERGEYILKLSAIQNNVKLTEYTKYIYADNKVVPHENVGVCGHFNRSQSYKVSDVASIKNTGFTIVRDEIRWDDVEITKGKYQIPSCVMEFVDKANASGMEVLLELAYNNSLYSGETATGVIPVTTENINAYCEYVRFVVKELKGKVKYFEVWNEPNHESFNKNNATAAQYVELLKKAYGIIKYENPEAVVISGSVAGASGAANYVKEMVAAGALNYMDVFGVHPYCCWSGAIVDERDSLDYASELDVLINECGVNKDIWITEVGYTTHYPGNGESDYYTEDEKGAYNVRTIIEFRADEAQRAKKLLLYLFKAEEEDEHFELVNADNTARDSYKIVRNANHILSNADFVKKWSTDYYSIYQFRDKTTDDDIFVTWTKHGIKLDLKTVSEASKPKCSIEYKILSNSILKIDVGAANAASKVYHYDAYGNKKIIEFEDSEILDFKPTYIVCKKEKNSYLNIAMENGDINGCGYINGTIPYVTVKAVEKYSKETVYLGQVSVGENGEFDFSLTPPDDGVYEIYVYNGELNYEKINLGSIDADMSLTSYGENVEAISQLNENDVIRAHVTIDNESDNIDNLLFVAAVYTENNKLLFAEIEPIGVETEIAPIDITVKDKAQWEKIKLFLWEKDSLMPIPNSLIINK